MSETWSSFLADEAATVAAGQQLAEALAPAVSAGGVVFLEGVLGAGKTTLCRGILTGFGHRGAVKSPTYTLVEPYQLNSGGGEITVYHFDLYRLGSPDELEFIGIRDYFQPGSLCVVEWPSRGEGFLPEPDLEVTVVPENDGRRLTIRARSGAGRQTVAALAS